MLGDRNGRRRVSRAFQPALNERLEERNFTSMLTPAARALQRRANLTTQLSRIPRGTVSGFPANGGSTIALTDSDSERYHVVVANAGTVRAQPGTMGTVFLALQGTQDNTTVDITIIGYPFQRQGNHTFVFPRTLWDRRLNLAGVDVTNGRIGGFFGFSTASLSGPFINRGADAIDRIALGNLFPGASIQTAGDINTLDIHQDVDLSGAGTGIFVGRDLNLFNVAGNMTIKNGANVIIGRDIGAEAQLPKGTGLGGRGVRIIGNLTIGEGSTFTVNRNLVGQIFIQGNLDGASRLIVNGFAPPGGIIVSGTVTP
jgi:hypothetical protein